MKKVLCLLVMSSLILALSSCSKDDAVSAIELKLEKTSVALNTGEKVEIKIESGNGGYTAVAQSGDPQIASVTIKDGKVVVEGLHEGNTKVTVSDAEKKTVSIDVTVTSAIVIPNKATFNWGNTPVEFDKAGGYGITIFSTGVALTDVASDKKQYVLTWEGGLTEGDKQNGQLVIVGSDNNVETVKLNSIKVIQANDEGNYLTFSNGSKNGELFFNN